MGDRTERARHATHRLIAGRRQFLIGAASAVFSAELTSRADAAYVSPSPPRSQVHGQPAAQMSGTGQRARTRPDFQLAIEPVKVEIARGKIIETTGYNGRAPGPLIRVRENQDVAIAVQNKTARADIVHWHGLHIPSIMDGAMEEGSPMIEPGGSFVYEFAARPSGSRWYHSHQMAAADLTMGLYTGEYGFFYIDPAKEPGRYDQEIFLALRHWEPSWVSLQDFNSRIPANNGLEIVYKSASINNKSLGHGAPLRVRAGERVLMRLLNASATQATMLALPGHRFTVIAMDGNPVPKPQTVGWLFLAPGERIDAIVEMNQPGVWILGSIEDGERASGMGIVVEYAGAGGVPVWLPHPIPKMWDYTQFAHSRTAHEPDERIELVFQKRMGGRGKFNTWMINGKSWPHTDPIRVIAGKRYRVAMHNLSFDMHPIHLHRHSFEVTTYMGVPTSGLMKDVVMLPGRGSAEIDFMANDPGPSLLHCHMQDHQDFGFMALVEYS